MPDDLSNRDAENRGRINVNEPPEIRYWTARLDVSDVAAGRELTRLPVF